MSTIENTKPKKKKLIIMEDPEEIEGEKKQEEEKQEEEKQVEEKEHEDTVLELQLGDVIQIFNPVNENLNTNTFIIDYIDSSKAYLINIDTLDRIKIKISPDGTIGDGNITKIAILSRSSTPSYARQNDLLPGKWVNIHFGGDYPVILTGEITNLEEDMIEITTGDDNLYINFDYKGIPEDLPIESIEIREKPSEKSPEKPEEESNIEPPSEEETALPDMENDYEVIDTNKFQNNTQLTNIKNKLSEIYLRADQVKFGDEELGPVVQYVEVSSKFQRYSIETQLSDLMDDLLSTIPNIQRTPRVLNNIHITIERFKQLRERFSSFDNYGNIDGIIAVEANYKPLISYFNKFKTNLFWILPTVKNIKKVYNVSVDEEISDVTNISLDQDLTYIKDIIDRYKSNTMPIDQNKYETLYSELNPYFTPFELIGEEDNFGILNEKIVKNDINVVVDNLDDFKSSVVKRGRLRTGRFIIERYTDAVTKLDTTEKTNSSLITKRANINKTADTMSINSFLFLPEPIIRFSKINLPDTDILNKANLNLVFLNYWNLLKDKTNVQNIMIDTLEGDLEVNENSFASNIKQYILNLPGEEINNVTRNQLYKKFTNFITPKIRVLFNLMKKYINGKLSIVSIVSYLEPFLIYTDELTYKQYEDITKFIDNKISEYNINFVERMRIFSILSRIKSQDILPARAFSIINILSDALKETIFQDYDIRINKNTSLFTNSELIRKITLRDYSKLYTTAISLQNLPLMFPSDISTIFDSEKKSLEESEHNEEENDNCKTMIVAKYYTSLDALQNDNDMEIYFDKKYDKTNYNLLENDYEKQILTLSGEELKTYIINDLMEKKKMTESEANYLADTLVDGHKKVIDGQYAILFKGTQANNTKDFDYYIRKNNNWSIDQTITKDIAHSDDPNILCNLQEKCISVNDKIDDKCESVTLNEVQMQEKLLKDIMNEFDTKYKISNDELENEINKQYNYYSSIIGALINIENNKILKYNNQQYKLGAGIEDSAIINIISPNMKLLNLILSQSDFVKKQYDIVRFVNLYTRPHISAMWNIGGQTNGEDTNWLYCPKTNTKILPVFKFELASEYIRNPDGYTNFLDILKSKIGKLSDDGDMWCDKYTGWPICPVDFDIEEGYEEGFKISTRGQLEEDAGNKIASSKSEVVFKYDTPEMRMINNIVNALCSAMGINIENQKEFIINCVLKSLGENLETETDYKETIKEMANKGRKIASYKDYYNSNILYFTLGMFLIAVQTSIPSVKTRKTHPGCVRSFSGYPFEGTGDFTSLKYLVCVAYSIRESGDPWNVLKGKKIDVITEKLKTSLDSILLPIPDIKRKFEEKTDYLLTNPASEIPKEHDITNWSQFLPPLVPFKIKHLTNISAEFKSSLINNLRIGSQAQREQILVIDSKIIQFSLAIQEKIQGVVKNQELILQNSNGEPYIENACCESVEGETTIGYFEKHSPTITEYNIIVQNLTNMMADIFSYSKAGILYSNINTKNKYPAVSTAFNEMIVYLSFIYFCKFKSLIPIPQYLLPLCNDKPDEFLFNSNDTIDRLIQKLKDEGRNYTNADLLRLLQLVGRNNIININLDIPEFSYVTKLQGLIENIRDENDEFIEGSLLDLLTNVLDTFSIASTGNKKRIADLNNYLITSIETMKEEIIDFIEKNSGTNITKSSIRKVKDCINNLDMWTSDNSNPNESIYTIINFYKTFIENFVSVFPNIIANKIEHSDTLIPKYYGFSDDHVRKLRTYINKYYEKLKTFYDAPIIGNILYTVQTTSKNIFNLSQSTPCFTSFTNKDNIVKPIFDETTSKYLYEFYLLKVFLNYIELSENNEMLVLEVQQKEAITDVFSVDFLDDNETRIDTTMTTIDNTNTRVIEGNMKDLRQKTAQLLSAYIFIMDNQKDTINTSYKEIQDRVFKLKDKEKNLVTDRLRQMTDEERDTDTILKINKLGMYGKGMQKGLVSLDKDFYDEEQEFRDQMVRAERKIRKKHKDIGDENIDLLVDDLIEQQQIDREIDNEAYDMSYMNEDYYNGNTDGNDAPEEEYDDYDDFN